MMRHMQDKSKQGDAVATSLLQKSVGDLEASKESPRGGDPGCGDRRGQGAPPQSSQMWDGGISTTSFYPLDSGAWKGGVGASLWILRPCQDRGNRPGKGSLDPGRCSEAWCREAQIRDSRQ
eukprot:1284997-Amphidinium_carterae.2